MRALNRLIMIALGTFALGLGTVPADAFAGKKDKGSDKGKDKGSLEMKDTGVASFDAVFTDVKAVRSDLKTTREELQNANNKINEALGLPEGTPVADAMAQLKTKADNKIEVFMDGTMPRVRPTDAVPNNVQAALDATNEAVTSWTTASEKLVGMGGTMGELAPKVAAMPAEIPNLGLAPTELPGVTKKVNNNLKVTNQTQDRIVKVGKAVKDNLDTVASLAPAAEADSQAPKAEDEGVEEIDPAAE